MTGNVAPKLYFEAPARVKSGLFVIKGGRLFVTSQHVFFVDELHAKLFDVQLHRVQDIYFRKNGRMIELTEKGRTHYIYPGTFDRWRAAVCFIGLVAGFIPGVVIFFKLVYPLLEENKKLTKKLQRSLAKHGITYD